MTTTHAATLTYEQCTRLAEAGKGEQALDAFREYLAGHPDDGAALNDVGALLYTMGRLDEAAVHLGAACSCLGEERGQALWNLAEVYLASGRPHKTLGLFADLAGKGLLTGELANRTATRFLDDEDRGGAVEALLGCQKALPNQDFLDRFIEAIRLQRPKVAFFCETGGTNFLTDICAFTGERFEARLYGRLTDEQMLEALNWCDIAWFEWCTGQLVRASQAPKVCRIICRLHRFEAYLDFPKAVRWENVDSLILVGNPYVRQYLNVAVPGIEQRTSVEVIPSAVNLERWAFVDRLRGKNIACMGYINQRKNPGLLLQCFWQLHKIDAEYRLFFGGQPQDAMLLQYVQTMIKELGLSDSVFIEGWQEDIVGWLDDKHYLVSASLGEGLPAGILEGMARGVKPIIHTWPGAREFFPPEWLFRTPDEFCRSILEGEYEPRAYREWVAQRYSLQAQLKSINRLLRHWEGNPYPPKDDDGTIQEKIPDGSNSPETREGVAHYDQWYRGATVRETWPQKARREKIVEAISTLDRTDLRIIDLGCGLGHLETHLVTFGSVIGVDWSHEAVETAGRHCPEATFVCGDIRTILLPRENFDVVVSVEVIEHFTDEDQQAHLERARDLLVPGGMLVMTTPNRPVMEALNNESIERNGKAWSDQPVENWLDQDRLQAMVEAKGFIVDRIEAFLTKWRHEGLHTLLVARKNGRP
ncbi:MAG: hypothetical protein AMK72_03895 [Planctomycetes bacterium SM23_25]|nr:MAG: hypothetical protein AMK72_03895 [Planctomycetes bacterium SM23_25]